MSPIPVQLGELTVLVTKGTTPTTYGRPFTDEGITFVKAEALNGDSNLNPEGFAFIDEDTHRMLGRSILRADDVLITIAGAQVGKCGFVRTEHLPANTNQAVGIVRVDATKANPRFIYYFFKLPATFTACQAMGAQSAQPNINLSSLKKVPIQLLPRNSQDRIAETLSAYDELIETNRRRMGLLEEAARLLYREWFVRLRYPACAKATAGRPGHPHTPLRDGLPAGWHRKPLSAVSDYLNRGIAPHYDDSAEGLVLNQKCIRNQQLDLSPARHQSREVPEAKRVRRHDILINSTGEGTLGRVAQVHAEIPNCTVDSHVTIVRPSEEIGPHYLGLAVMAYEPTLMTSGRGATNQTELSRDMIGELPILVPDREIVRRFEEQAEPIFTQVLTLQNQNRQLRTARDLLLPKLMSGRIAV